MNYFVIYLQLFGTALLPVIVALFFYLLERLTAFSKLKFSVKQIIIGVVFGIIAIMGTENGVDVGGATANARDAAPLCAGLFFGGPAGILAGLIGGVHRWFAISAGAYSRIACTVSTILAGLYAAFLRKSLFDDKSPTWGLSLMTGIVMEVVHITILFLTHISDAQTAYKIVKICTIPMIAANGVSVMLASIALSVVARKFDGIAIKDVYAKRKLSQKVQSWLLFTVVLSYLATTIFVFTLQTGTAVFDTSNMIKLYITDVKSEISDTSDRNILRVTRDIAKQLEKKPETPLNSLIKKYNVTEINIVDDNGIITRSTYEPFVGFDMSSGAQAAEFLVLNNGQNEYVQEYQPLSYDRTISRKYAGVALSLGGFVQVGYDAWQFHNDVSSEMTGFARNRHIGSTGYMLISDNGGKIVSSSNGDIGMSVSDTGITLNVYSKESELTRCDVNGVPSFWLYEQCEGYKIIGVMPLDEVFESRDAGAYVNSFMEVIVFAALFLLIYFLIKKLVVDNIRSVNDSLSKIIGGNLDVTVNVRSSEEFASLSDDINSTVTTLKHYIDAAAARIDEELEFAKKIQFSTLPSTFPAYPANKEFDIYATMCTAKEVGGDFYDLYKLGDNRLAFLIADVSGKGIPAAMFMMTAKTIIKGLAETGLPVNEILTHANEKLCEKNEAGMFVTVWMGILDIRTGHVTYTSAGHNPPLLYRNGIGFDYLKCRSGFVLAGMEGVKYKLNELDLEPGDRLYLYTDGVTEATDMNKTLYGEERLVRFLNSNSELSAKDTLAAVKSDIDRFVGEAEQFDDITMLMVDYNGMSSPLIAEKVFKANDAYLADATAFIDEILERFDCNMKIAMQIDVAFEEMFVNVAHYAYPDSDGDVKISLYDADDSIKIRLTDSGIAFDPLKKDDPDISLSADERSIGGLGIFMVKKTMDDVCYERKNGQNIFTMTKKIK